MGTAGHVDHGKTALIRALTGIECDTHREEKRRGITINLGFAHIELPGGDTVGIVDVPGHKNFVNTMVSGASGIDFVLLVIAADSGIMPQTREHFQIMQALGVQAGLIALTKIDLADNETRTLALEEIRELVRGSFLEQAPVIETSSRTGEGIALLRSEIAAICGRINQRPSGEVFRLFIDRIFTAAGFGTIVTGSAIGGDVHTGDTLYLLPSEKQLRVRRMERHGREVTEISAGDRASLNLVGLGREDFSRGMLISDRRLNATTLLDARLEMFHHNRRFGLWAQGAFLLGTFEAQARIHLLDRDCLTAGQTAIVQIHLPAPCVTMPGDRFVLRSSSSDLTLGGGLIIDAAPLHHRRRPAELIQRLQTIATGSLSELIAAEVRKRFAPVNHLRIADALNIPPAKVQQTIEAGLTKGVLAFESEDEYFLIVKQQYDRMRNRIQKELAYFHRQHPLSPGGQTIEELTGKITDPSDADSRTFVTLLLHAMTEENTLKRVGRTFALIDHTVTPDPKLQNSIAVIEHFLEASGLQLPLMNELKSYAQKNGVNEQKINQILHFLSSNDRAFCHENVCVHASIINPVREKLITALRACPTGLTVAQFRDLIGANRKFCLWAYGLFDREGITERRADVRVLTDKGQAL